MAGQVTFGAELRRRRQQAGLSLVRFGKLVHYSKGFLSKIETGALSAQPAFVRMCDAALNADGALIALIADATHKDEAPSDDASTGHWQMNLSPDGTGLFAPIPGPAPDPGIGLNLDAGRQAVDPAATAELFEARFMANRELGQLVSAQATLPMLIAETHTLRTLAASTPEGAGDLWRIAARFAEYVGWMCQEQGNDQQARWWTEMAVRLADRGGDASWRPFALLREADITMYADDGRRTVELALRAQADAAATVRVRGLAAQREAQGHALLGDRESCLRALDRSARLLAEAADAPVVQGVWTMQDPTLMARGWCLLDLGRPGEAAAVLESGMAGFVAGASRARAKLAVRAALAQATADEMERACEIVELLAGDLRQLDSATIRHDVRLLQREFRRRGNQPRVRQLIPILADL